MLCGAHEERDTFVMLCRRSMLSIVATSPLSFAARAPMVKMQADMTAKDLPGVTAPFGFFDPLGFTKDLSPAELMLRRESELAHGRVAMVGALGFLVQESFHPIFPGVDGPAINQLGEITTFSWGLCAFATMSIAIASAELTRARIGWVDPNDLVEGGSRLQDGYIPGDLGFDPFGMKPQDADGMASMLNKEINNGRLAMIAVAGMVGQELVTQKGLFGA
jgi:light-harvesting complex I chlorophyll a/b binding protein 4